MDDLRFTIYDVRFYDVNLQWMQRDTLYKYLVMVRYTLHLIHCTLYIVHRISLVFLDVYKRQA